MDQRRDWMGKGYTRFLDGSLDFASWAREWALGLSLWAGSFAVGISAFLDKRSNEFPHRDNES